MVFPGWLAPQCLTQLASDRNSIADDKTIMQNNTPVLSHSPDDKTIMQNNTPVLSHSPDDKTIMQNNTPVLSHSPDDKSIMQNNTPVLSHSPDDKSVMQNNTPVLSHSPVCKVFGLFATTNQLDDGVEHLTALTSTLLFLQHQHEVVSETRLHHNPVDGAGQVDISRQEYNVFTCADKRLAT